MIQEALSCLVDEINGYCKSRLKINEDKVILSGIMNPDGTSAIRGENKVLVTLVNIEKDTVSQMGVTQHTSSPLNINLYILFSASFAAANYPEALRFLTFIMGYLQQKNVFNRTNTPQLDEGIEKLVFEMENLPLEKMNNVWSTLGAKYIPSVMYKVRMLTIDGSIVREFRPAISGIQN
jgi:hypothetical protein